MRIARLVSLLLASLVLTVGTVWAQQTRTVEGTLVDAKCYLADPVANAGNDHGDMKGCGTMCLKGGSPGAVVTKDKTFHAIIASSRALADYVGLQVRVTGTEHNGALLAQKVEVNKDGKWQQVKLGTMM